MQSDQPQDSLRAKELEIARSVSGKGDWEQAYDIAYKWLKLNPADADALNIIAYILLNTGKVALAYPLLKYLLTLEPTNALGWLNMGMAASDLWRYNEAIRSYKKGIQFAGDEDQKSMLCVNMASVMVDHGHFKEAQPYCEEAIKLRPETVKGKANLGFCQLAQRNWAGWENYRYCIDSEWRPLIQYNDEPLWTGEKGKICIYSEQGLGDEISFGQMLIDMKAWCDDNESQLVVDVNPRLESLFKRSFTDIEIHGTRGIKQISWDPRDIDYSLPMAQLGETFRTRDEDFTGQPYLVADADRVLQWQSLFETKKKPVVGLAWRSGVWKTGAKYRQIELEDLLPVLQSVDAHWVSLQYKSSSNEIASFKNNHPEIDLVEYPFCTLSNDYDDTVAMIAAMDRVVAVQTTAIHVAGGLGIPCDVLVPKSSQWRYGQTGTDYPWAKSVKIARQTKRGDWSDIIEKLGEELANHFRLSKTTGTDAPKQKDKLRCSGGKVRRNRERHDRFNGGRPPA